MQIIKRSGKHENLDIQKVRKVIEWTCEGLDASPAELEARVSIRFKDGITTEEIQKNVIQGALELCDINAPDWRYVAGRLYLWDYRKAVATERGYEYGNLAYTLIANDDVYCDVIYDYSGYEIQRLNEYIKPERDLDYDYAGAITLTKKYLRDGELPQEMLMITAMVLASNKKEDRLQFAKDIYDAISLRMISLATPLLANARFVKGSMSSCFITMMDDSLESIFNHISDIAKISKNGGGVGLNISNIRATGSEINGRPNSSGGIVPWVKIVNDTAIAVNQG